VPAAIVAYRRITVDRDERHPEDRSGSRVTGAKPWIRPEIADLPKLTDLTLLTGSPIPGTGGTGGSSVF